MSLVDRVRARTLEVRRADPVTLEEFDKILGQSRGLSTQTKSGNTIGAQRALAIPAWYSGVRYLAETTAALPVHTYRDDAGVRSQRLDPLWMQKPDVEQPWFGLIEFVMMSLLHQGNAYAFKLRNPAGQVVGLRELFPDRITVGQAPDGTKRFVVDRDERLWTTRDIMHIPGLAYNGRVGLNPIRNAADALGGIAAADDYSQRWFSNGTHLGGIISVPQKLTGPQAEELRDEWDAFHQGLINAHKTGVLSLGATYNRVSLSAADTQLIESRQYGIAEIARLLRLPPHKLYDLTRATYSNIEHQSIEAITDGIQPWVERIEAYINFDPDLLPAGNFIEFSLEGRLRGDTVSRYTAFAQSVGAPWMTRNEARRLENLPEVVGGDELLSPLNMAGGASDDEATPREIAEMIQKVYLGVGVVLSADEARALINKAGAGFSGPLIQVKGGNNAAAA